MKPIGSPVFNSAGFSVTLSNERCTELSEQLRQARHTYNARLLRGCAPADFAYVQQLIYAIDVAQSVIEKEMRR